MEWNHYFVSLRYREWDLIWISLFYSLSMQCLVILAMIAFHIDVYKNSTRLARMALDEISLEI